MNVDNKLKLGVAYHGNRMLKHVREDMLDIIQHHFNLVVHMFSHNDWDRHKNIMKEIVEISEEAGLEVWIDNWGLGGPPGDKSHFLSYYPDAHQIYSNGEVDPVRVCLNNKDFRNFTKEWIDVVDFSGAKSIFWDEPHLAGKDVVNGKPRVWTCHCKTCQQLFVNKYSKGMPEILTEEVEQFRIDTIVDYFREVTDYSKKKGMYNSVCVMLGATHGINLETIDQIAGLESLDNVGSDPYWLGHKGVDPYEFVYDATKKNLDISNKFNKDHNIWIQCYSTPRGREEEIISATDAAYDAGARTILAWGYRGSDANDYRAKNPELTWKITGDAMYRVLERDRNERRESYIAR
ncbi:MAG: hypothetical protein GX783_08260 [Clostridiales bacterium]|nr:hypothetical protein [Clostridiales bacterium]